MLSLHRLDTEGSGVATCDLQVLDVETHLFHFLAVLDGSLFEVFSFVCEMDGSCCKLAVIGQPDGRTHQSRRSVLTTSWPRLFDASLPLV